MATKLSRFVAKRTNATPADPTAEATVLGFIDAPDTLHAAEAALVRWGVEGDDQMLVVLPVGLCSVRDLQEAAAAELDDKLGPSYGKRVVRECVACHTINYAHPRQRMMRCRQCNCLLPFAGRHSKLIDVRVATRHLQLFDEAEEGEEEHHDIGGSD